MSRHLKTMNEKDPETPEVIIEYQIISDQKEEKNGINPVSEKVTSEENSLLHCNNNNNVQPQDTAPDGGYGWLIVLGCFLSHILIGGFERSDGVYYLKFKSYYDKSSQLTAWPNALVSAIRLFLGPFASALSNMYSVRTAVILGTILMTAGQILTAYSPNFFFLFFSQSILQGVGGGLVYLPSIVIVGVYFDKHRGLAAGLGSAGVGVGTFCIVPLTQWFFDNMSFQESFLILAGIAFNGMVVAMLFRPLSLHNKWTQRTRIKQETEQDKDPIKPNIDIKTEEISNHHLSLITTSAQVKPVVHKNKKNCFKSSLMLFCPIENKKKTKDKKQIFNFSLLCDPSFFMFCVSLTLFTAAFKAAFTFIPALVKSRGSSESDAALVLSVAGVFDTFGRIAAGIIFDLRKIKLFRLLLFNLFIFIIAGISFLLPFLNSFAAFCILCSLYGIFTGAYISQKSVVIVDILGVENLSTSFGLLICFQTIGICAGPPLAGAFRDIFGTFDEAFYFGGGFMTVAGLLMVISNILLRAKKSQLLKTATFKS